MIVWNLVGDTIHAWLWAPASEHRGCQFSPRQIKSITRMLYFIRARGGELDHETAPSEPSGHMHAIFFVCCCCMMSCCNMRVAVRVERPPVTSGRGHHASRHRVFLLGMNASVVLQTWFRGAARSHSQT